jgi:hypothetical protein
MVRQGRWMAGQESTQATQLYAINCVELPRATQATQLLLRGSCLLAPGALVACLCEELGRGLINAQPKADLHEPPTNVRYRG